MAMSVVITHLVDPSAMPSLFLRCVRMTAWRSCCMVLLVVCSAQALRAQRLMTAVDLGALSAGPPTATIAYGPEPLQFGKLRLPTTPGPHPVLIFVHGGCWLSAYDIAHVGALEQALADSGIAVWSLEYRRVGDAGGGWPGTFTDIARGADYLREIAARYQLDLHHVVASGHSAGGAAALWLAARTQLPATSPLFAKAPLPIQAVVSLAPAADFDALQASGVCGNVVTKLMGGTPAERPERYAAVSPLRLAPIGVPQRLVIGAQDAAWGPGGRAYAARAHERGEANVQLVELPQSGHFEMINPASSSWPAVLAAFRAGFAATATRP